MGTVYRKATPAGAVFLGQICRQFIRRDLCLIPGIDTKCASKFIGSGRQDTLHHVVGHHTHRKNGGGFLRSRLDDMFNLFLHRGEKG